MYNKVTEGTPDRMYVVEHIVEDIPGGGTIAKADFPDGTKYLLEGAVVGKDANGLYHVIKTSATLADSTATAPRVPKGHPFKVGDTFEGGTKTITAVTAGATYDTLTIDVALTTFAEGTILEADNTVEPEAVTINSVDFEGENHGSGLCVRGRVREANMAFPPSAASKAALDLIRFV